jgi:hypothetical protein
MTPEETARYMRKSLSWVYKNSAALGGRKLGGSLFFQLRRTSMSTYFVKGKGWRYNFILKGTRYTESLVRHQKSGQESRGRKKKGDRKPDTGARDSNRYGLFDLSQQAS